MPRDFAAPSTKNPLQSDLRFLKGVGPRRAAECLRVDLRTCEDLLFRFPIRFEDRSLLRRSVEVKAGEVAALSGEVVSVGLRQTRRKGFSLVEMLARDDSGTFQVVWINQPFLKEVFTRGQRVSFYGKTVWRKPGGLRLENPHYEVVGEQNDSEDKGLHTARIVPIYERIGTLTTKQIRQLVYATLQLLPDSVEEVLPFALRQAYGLPGRRQALWEAHFPTAGTSMTLLNSFRTPAQKRLILEELFLFQLGLGLRRRAQSGKTKIHRIAVDDRIRRSARKVLPFSLTTGQRQALKTIVDDLCRPEPMNRLLQGDVGCGKTIVALLAALVTMENTLQVALMAPTELLAEQHYLSLRDLLDSSRFRVVLITGGSMTVSKRSTMSAIKNGQVNLIVGTHALVQQGIQFRALGLVIIDEQHRFGVLQRATLRQKGSCPDVLVMTATPIPRTLALASYGDLDVSVIRDMPPGRSPVMTRVTRESERDSVYDFVAKELGEGKQAFVVYPLVEESEKLDLKAATAMVETLRRRFDGYKVGLLHGRMKTDDRAETMRLFSSNDLHVLVSTTVIEVGVDIPNASVMVVEHAERFGLAQLHQLRGRVGRGRFQGYCCLLYKEPISEIGNARLKALASTTDGFEIAEEDLKLRGPGEMLGTRQSGVPTFRVADLVRDQGFMETAHNEAVTILGRSGAVDKVLRGLDENWKKRFGLAVVG